MLENVVQFLVTFSTDFRIIFGTHFETLFGVQKLAQMGSKKRPNMGPVLETLARISEVGKLAKPACCEAVGKVPGGWKYTQQTKERDCVFRFLPFAVQEE